MEENKTFRDTIATVDEKGKRVWIYPKKPKGKFFNYRKWLSYFLLAALFGMPYVKIGGEPMLLLNIIERKFVIFGQVFWPQDLFIFAMAMITFIVFIILFTIIFGRLFCGWVCPQTIFMEMVFRRIEYWIEGDWTHQKRLNEQPWNAEKIRKKTLKHVLFWIISFAIANTFLAYIIGYESLWALVTDGVAAHIGGLIAISVFTTVFYAVFAFMREQVCTTVCPYGRLQGVLLDKNSLVVAYDYVRGEGRAKFKKGEDRQAEGKGDCIDCKQCIHVCPTGIDIRNGTQLECVNCTACMDVCDEMMEGVGLEKGLIRIASEDGIKNKVPFQWTNRVKAYVGVLFILLTVITTLIVYRSEVQVTILRTRGTTFQEVSDTHISNIYDVTLVNKSNKERTLELKILEGVGQIEIVGDDLFVGPNGQLHRKFIIRAERTKIKKTGNEIIIGVYDGDRQITTAKTNFVGPKF
jgi:cytochrome c oxidase accessory protein FixG